MTSWVRRVILPRSTALLALNPRLACKERTPTWGTVLKPCPSTESYPRIMGAATSRKEREKWATRYLGEANNLWMIRPALT
jgi:hypothetical protein